MWLAGTLFGLVLLVFAEARHGRFLPWDDDINITVNPYLRQWDAASLVWMFTDVAYMRRYAPLTWLNWAVEHQLFGLTAYSAHLGNVILHAGNAVLVFFLMQSLLRTTQSASLRPRLAFASAAAAALLWAVHPLRVEPVAWASGRIYLLATFFLLVCALAYLQAVRPGISRRQRLLYWAVVLTSYAASLLTYPLAITFVGVLFVVDIWVLQRFRATAAPDERRRALLEKIPLAAMAFACALATLLARVNASGIWVSTPDLQTFSLSERLAQSAYVWVYYVWKPLYPAGLAPVYTDLLEVSPTAPRFILSQVALVGITLVLLRVRKRYPAALAAWLCHLCLLVPTLGFIERPHFPSDRYSYIASLPWFALLAGGVVFWTGNPGPRRAAFVTLAVMTVSWMTITRLQIPAWYNPETLFRHILAQLDGHPYGTDIHRRLGDFYLEQQRAGEARTEYERALALRPWEGLAHFGHARALEAAGDWEGAAASYRAAVQPSDPIPLAHVYLGRLRLRTGQPDQALDAFREAARLLPLNPEPHAQLAALLLQSGRVSEAASHARVALRLRPADPSIQATHAAIAAALSEKTGSTGANPYR